MPEIETSNQHLKALSGLHLWHAPMSSCSQRVRIALEEADANYSSHLVDLNKGEHASAEFQSINPKGLVPALVDNGRVFIESIDIIQHVWGSTDRCDDHLVLSILDLADNFQSDLKTLTFEFLFKGFPQRSTQENEAFEASHNNEDLKQFHRNFSSGFSTRQIEAAVHQTEASLDKLNGILTHGGDYLAGDSFTLADIAWMPNVHRLGLMGCQFGSVARLETWFAKVGRRKSYQKGLLAWQNDSINQAFATYTKQRQIERTDITAFALGLD